MSPPPAEWRGHRSTSAPPPGVEYALSGTVRMAGRRFRVTVQLIDTRDHTHAWGAVFDGDLDDIFDAESQIARSVATDVARELREPPSLTAAGPRALRA
jgi:adenylate cyclase